MTDNTDKTEAIDAEIVSLVTEQKDLEKQELALMEDSRFSKFLEAQKKFKLGSELLWSAIEQQMIANNIKSVKGEWGSVTIAERTGFDIDLELLPAKFIKKVADTKKIGDTYKLEGKPPKGTSPKITKYLMKRIK